MRFLLSTTIEGENLEKESSLGFRGGSYLERVLNRTERN